MEARKNKVCLCGTRNPRQNFFLLADEEEQRIYKYPPTSQLFYLDDASRRTVGCYSFLTKLVKMGGCCCSSRQSHLVGTPVYYYCPESFQELGPSGARVGVGSAALTTGLLVDIGLETSIPDTFCAPAPLPYDLLLGRPQCADSESIKGKISESSFEMVASCQDLGGLDCKNSSVVLSPSESDLSKQKTWNQLVDEEEDSCPICFEDYDVENPKIKTNCEHDFHLSCLLEWMERSDSCPICDKEVVFDDCLN